MGLCPSQLHRSRWHWSPLSNYAIRLPGGSMTEQPPSTASQDPRLLRSPALADLGGPRPARAPPPYGSRFFHFDMQNFQNVAASEVHGPPYEVHAPPPTGNPGSATDQCLKITGKTVPVLHIIGGNMTVAKGMPMDQCGQNFGPIWVKSCTTNGVHSVY